MTYRISATAVEHPSRLALAFKPDPSATTWSRLEPLPTSDDVSVGLQARIADPLWMLARQWQFNEFQGEDAGSPISADAARAGRAGDVAGAAGGAPPDGTRGCRRRSRRSSSASRCCRSIRSSTRRRAST